MRLESIANIKRKIPKELNLCFRYAVFVFANRKHYLVAGFGQHKYIYSCPVNIE